MSDCVNYLTLDDINMWTEQLHNKLKKADRVLKVLENVSWKCFLQNVVFIHEADHIHGR